MTPFNAAQFLSDTRVLVPEIFLCLFAFIILVVSAILPAESRRAIAWLALFGTLMIIPTVFRYANQLGGAAGAPVFSGDVAVDSLAFFFKILVLVAAAIPLFATIAVALGVWACDPLAQDTHTRVRPTFAYAYLILSSLYTYALNSQRWHVRLAVIVLVASLALVLFLAGRFLPFPSPELAVVGRVLLWLAFPFGLLRLGLFDRAELAGLGRLVSGRKSVMASERPT